MKRKNELKIGDALQLMIQELGWEEKLLATQAELAWAKVMGDFVTKYTISVKVERRILIVKLSSSELRHELSFGKSKMLNHLNEEIGSDFLTDIRLV